MYSCTIVLVLWGLALTTDERLLFCSVDAHDVSLETAAVRLGVAVHGCGVVEVEALAAVQHPARLARVRYKCTCTRTFSQNYC